MRSLVVKVLTLAAIGATASSKKKSGANPDKATDNRDNDRTVDEEDGTDSRTSSAYTIPGLVFGAILLVAGLTM